ncbi:MAG: TrpB-like pyridoxal phosphate-dependent enzyme [Spirochaetales bacterium]|nr:TrpB-like pyridoxal phosphate-dependent enzyme [Spirochaetales bacterium]
MSIQRKRVSPVKIVLSESQMPRQWYNLAADFRTPLLPPLGPDGKPVTPEMMSAIFPMNLIEQEMTSDRWVDIPDEILQILYRWRPSPLHRALALEELLDTPARIYYKNESVSPAGSHKLNTAIAQAYYNKIAGTKNITTETGAGQWGSALSYACTAMGLTCKVYMVKVSFEQKPFRKMLMQTWGGTCIASPSNLTNAGRAVLEKDPNCPGSLAIAISEAVEEAVADKTGKTKYALGSVLNHVMLHQTIIGQETKKQLELAGEKQADVVIACAGGGSNLAGLTFPFCKDKIEGDNIEIIAVEPESCPTLTRGPFAYDIGDMSGMTPLLPMYTLGHEFIPDPIHAGGLRYHGMAPLVSKAVADKLIEPRSIGQEECFDAAIKFARSEGIVPAPESSHALAMAMREAVKAKEEGKEKVIVFGLSGHGLLDLVGYDKYLSGNIKDHEPSPEQLARSLDCIKNFPKP